MNSYLKPGIYVVMAPEHLENDEIDAFIDDLHEKDRLHFEYMGYSLFAFTAARGIGPYEMKIGNNCPGTVDCDYGALIAIPIDLIKELNNPYTLWFLGNGAGQMACPFQIEKEYAPEYENGVFILDDISIDTKVIFNPDDNELINNLQPDQQLSRKMTLYVALRSMFDAPIDQ